jgi:GNAT superfamily N-acetyltransferase
MYKTQLEPMLRPIAPGDLERLRRFGCRLSPQSRYQRFLTGMRRLPEPLLRRFVEVDHDDREALVAVGADGEIVGVARYDRIALPGDSAGPRRRADGAARPDRADRAGRSDRADVAIVVADDWQRRGIGTLLLGELAEMALAAGIGAWTASCLADNRAVHALIRRGWPAARAQRDGTMAEYVLPLPMRRDGAHARSAVQPAVPVPRAAPVPRAVPVAAAPGASPRRGLPAMVAAASVLSALSGQEAGNLQRSPDVAIATKV